MKKLMCSIWAVLIAGILVFPVTLNARSGHSKYSSKTSYSKGSSSKATKSVHVKGYTRKDGTKVEGYDRSLPETTSPKTIKSSTSEITVPKAETVVPQKHKSTHAEGVARNKNGKIKRSEKAKDDFKKANPCPTTGKGSGSCPGYVIDHIMPLKRGGTDAPDNMQWQTEEAAKAKDKVE